MDKPTPRVNEVLFDTRTGRTIIVHGHTFEALAELARTLERELQSAREDALEQAAKVCEEITQVPHGDGSYTGMFTHFGNKGCAEAIRALSAAGREG